MRSTSFLSRISLATRLRPLQFGIHPDFHMQTEVQKLRASSLAGAARMITLTRFRALQPAGAKSCQCAIN